MDKIWIVMNEFEQTQEIKPCANLDIAKREAKAFVAPKHNELLNLIDQLVDDVPSSISEHHSGGWLNVFKEGVISA